MAFWRGFERDGAKTSGFFKLQKIRTEKKYIFQKFCLVLNFHAHTPGGAGNNIDGAGIVFGIQVHSFFIGDF